MSEKSRRLQRAEKEIREVISTYLTQAQAGSTSELVCLTQVLVSADLRQVKAYVCVLGQEQVSQDTLEILQSHAPQIQKLFNGKFRMKHCPRVKFYNDEGVKIMARLDAIMGEI